MAHNPFIPALPKLEPVLGNTSVADDTLLSVLSDTEKRTQHIAAVVVAVSSIPSAPRLESLAAVVDPHSQRSVIVVPIGEYGPYVVMCLA
jgi:hypothetical protein